MAWDETTSPHFCARHDDADADDVVEVLELLEGTRDRLGDVFAVLPDEVDVIVHSSRAQLDTAAPLVPFVVRFTAPAARRYVVGWPGSGTIHLLAPRILRARASNVPGSREMAMLAPAALYAQLVVGANNPRLPPPYDARSLRRAWRWAWMWAGAAQWFSGQTAYARPAIGRRLHESGEPSFPPGQRDALLLGGSVLDLLAREEGASAVVRFVTEQPSDTPRRALERAFHGRSLRHTEGAWRSHLARLAGMPAPAGRGR